MPLSTQILLRILIFPLLALTACTTADETPTPAGPTPPGAETTPGDANPPPLSSPTPAPEPTPTREPRTLTICMGAEPESLYLYGSSMYAQRNILAAVYDGPIDQNDFSYQPVILEKLPSLTDGDALLQPVTVRTGDPVVDADGNVTTLAEGAVVRPAGCQSPTCAVSYEGGDFQMDQLSATFTLLPGLKWSDGAPLTAQDSVYSFRLAAHPDTPGSKFVLERTASYTAQDERTAQWVGLPGYLDQTYFTNFWHPLPQHAWGSLTATDLLQDERATRRPMGWGAYIITEWTFGHSIRLAKNQHYFRADEGLPHFDNVLIRFTRSSETSASLLLSGECDILDLEAAAAIPYAELLNLDQSRQLQAHFTTGTVWEHADFGIVPAAYDDGYQLGVDRPDLFGDARTRRAIAHCMDRQKIVNTLLLGQSEVPHTYLPSSHPLFNPDAPQYPFDPQAGMALLDEVGWRDHDGNPATPRLAQGIPNVPDGTPLSFGYWTTTATLRQQVGQILADSLAQCGVQIDFQAWEPEELFANGPEGPLFGRRFDMAQFAWLIGVTPPCDLFLTEQIPGEDPERYPYRWGGTNLTGYNNPAFDEACRAALSILPGQPDYEDAHHLAQQIFAEDLPVIPLYIRFRVTAARTDFCNHIMDATANSDFWNIEEYDYGEGCAGE